MAEVLLALAWDHDAYWSFCRLLICKTQGKVFPVNQNLPWCAVFEYHCISNYESPSTQNAWLAIGDALVRLLEESRITEKRCKSKLCVSVWVRYPVFPGFPQCRADWGILHCHLWAHVSTAKKFRVKRRSVGHLLQHRAADSSNRTHSISPDTSGNLRSVTLQRTDPWLSITTGRTWI